MNDSKRICKLKESEGYEDRMFEWMEGVGSEYFSTYSVQYR